MAKDDSGLNEIEEYSKKLSANPESLVFVPLAEAYRKSGMLDEAIETCLKGLQIHSSYMSARMVLGRAYMDKEMLEEAATEFRKVAAADINNIMAHSLLGQIYMKQGRHANAIEEYQKVLSLNPDDQSTQQMLGKALDQARQNNAGRTEGPAGGGREKKVDLTRAEELTRKGDIDNAIKLYQLILEGDPENLVVRQRLRDLELRKVQASTERRAPERPKSEPAQAMRDRDNDKITSDDILSVMKETGIKFSEKAKETPEPPKAAAPKAEEPRPEPAKAETAKAAAPKAEEPKPEPAKAETAKAAAPKAEEPKPEPAKAETAKAQPAVETAGKTLLPALTKMTQTEGILGGLLLDIQGNVLANTFKTGGDPKAIAAVVTLIYSKTEKSVQAMDYGKHVHQILVTGEKGLIIFNKLGNMILVVLADQNINIGKLRLAMNDLVKNLRGGG